MKAYFIYILSSNTGTLYIGVTNDLWSRILTHKYGETPGFTNRYNICRLIYYEVFTDIEEAIAREKELKGWKRKRKLALIRSTNPKFEDLADDW